MSQTDKQTELLTKNEQTQPETQELPRLSKMINDILTLAIPGILTYIFNCSGTLATFALLGRLEPKYMGAIGLGATMAGFLAGSPLTAFASGLDSLIPQSFGKKDYQMCGIYLNRGLVILGIIGIPLYIVTLFSTHIMKLLGIAASRADLSGIYAIYLIPAMTLAVASAALNSFMAGQRVVLPSMTINLVTSALQPLWIAIFVFWLNGGYIGAAFGSISNAGLTCLFYVIYIYKSGKFDQSIAPWNNEVLNGWRSFCTICGLSGIMSCLGAWAYHLMGFFAGHLSDAELAAHVSLLNILAWMYMMPVGIGNAATILVGNKLGGRNVAEAKQYAKLCVVINFGASVVLELTMLIFRKEVGQIFSSSPHVQELIGSVIPIIVFANVFDVIQGVFYKIIYAIGRQKYASYVLIVSHWIVRVPIAIVMTFVLKLGLYGLWTTYIFSYACAAIGFAYVVIREDWDKISNEIYERIEKDKLTHDK